MSEPMTSAELQAISEHEISASDKDLIETVVEAEVGLNDNDLRVRALRGYLVNHFLEIYPDDRMRDTLLDTAAGFSDGWSYCLKYGIPAKIWLGQ